MINDKRLLNSLAELRKIGRCGSGVIRPAFSPDDLAARHWLSTELNQCGLQVHIDPAGNVFGVPPDSNPCLLLGSHTDTQPEGGWLDGALGVIAALEIARARHEQGKYPIAVVSFQDEEGRFGGTVGSMVWSGQLSLEEVDKQLDADGVSFKQARNTMNSDHQPVFVPVNRFSAYLEMHIEQGPFLDDSDDVVGIVDSIVGVRQLHFHFSGQQNHAGTTPMYKRKDAFRALGQLSTELDIRLRPLATPATVWTIGQVNVFPNAPSIVPGAVEFTLQWRDVDEQRLDDMHTVINQLVDDISMQFKIDAQKSEIPRVHSAAMDTRLCNTLENAAHKITNNRYRRMPSAAIHDAGIVSRVLPSAMLFVPSIDGISHDFAEDTDPEHLVIGARVLAEAVDVLLHENH